MAFFESFSMFFKFFSISLCEKRFSFNESTITDNKWQMTVDNKNLLVHLK